VDVLPLDSNTRPSGWPVTNAIGLVGRAQLRDARRLLAGRDPTRVLLITLHHHLIPPVSVAAALLVCVDDLEILDLAAEYGAKAIAHGHTPMPDVCTLRYKGKYIRIISCGFPLFAPSGPLAEIVRYPSCFGLELDGGRLKDPVLLFTRTPDIAATQVGHRG